MSSSQSVLCAVPCPAWWVQRTWGHSWESGGTQCVPGGQGGFPRGGWVGRQPLHQGTAQPKGPWASLGDLGTCVAVASPVSPVPPPLLGCLGWGGSTVRDIPPTPMSSCRDTSSPACLHLLDEPLFLADNIACRKENTEVCRLICMRVSSRALPGHPLASGGSGREPGASKCPGDGGRMMRAARERRSVRAEVGWGRCREGSPPHAPQLSHSPRSTRVLESPLQPGRGVCVLLAGWGLPHRLCSLQTHPSPLIFLCGSSRACQKNALDGARERAGRVVRVCALVCACVATDFIKASCPRAAEARQPLILWPGSCGKPTSPCALLPQKGWASLPPQVLARGLSPAPWPLPQRAGRWAAGLPQDAEDGVGRKELDTWLQLGWTTLQPVPPAAAAALGAVPNCGFLPLPGAGWKDSDPCPSRACSPLALRQGWGVKRGWFGLAGRAVGRM